MAYCHEYINRLDQFGISMFSLKLKDTDNILPETIIPVSLYNNEITEEKLDLIAKTIIEEQTKIHTKIEIIDNNILIDSPIDITVIDNTSVVSNEDILITNQETVETTENVLNTDIG